MRPLPTLTLASLALCLAGCQPLATGTPSTGSPAAAAVGSPEIGLLTGASGAVAALPKAPDPAPTVAPQAKVLTASPTPLTPEAAAAAPEPQVPAWGGTPIDYAKDWAGARVETLVQADTPAVAAPRFPSQAATGDVVGWVQDQQRREACAKLATQMATYELPRECGG